MEAESDWLRPVYEEVFDPGAGDGGSEGGLGVSGKT